VINYAGEYGEYCSACQSAVSIIKSSDAAMKSCIEQLTMNSRKLLHLIRRFR